jgi:hypothetical protein
MLRITFGGLGSFGLKAIRNRQVASSTLALGSNIPLEDKDLADSLNCLCPIRCKVVTNSEVFAQRIHRAHLRFIHALDVNVLSYPDVAVAKSRLDGFVVHAEVVKVCRDTPAKCVPAVPVGKGIVTLIGVAFGFVPVSTSYLISSFIVCCRTIFFPHKPHRSSLLIGNAPFGNAFD